MAFPPLTDVALARLRVRAVQLAEVLGVPTASVGPTLDSVWVYSDMSMARFGSEVPAAIMADPALVLVRDSVALVESEDDDGETVWTTAEKVRQRDLELWRAEKQMEKQTGTRYGTRYSKESYSFT